ncbi:hypothetical protein PFISCL1PPCAC_2431, partial [Pristionchus fissidentatus]
PPSIHHLFLNSHSHESSSSPFASLRLTPAFPEIFKISYPHQTWRRSTLHTLPSPAHPMTGNEWRRRERFVQCSVVIGRHSIEPVSRPSIWWPLYGEWHRYSSPATSLTRVVRTWFVSIGPLHASSYSVSSQSHSSWDSHH